MLLQTAMSNSTSLQSEEATTIATTTVSSGLISRAALLDPSGRLNSLFTPISPPPPPQYSNDEDEDDYHQGNKKKKKKKRRNQPGNPDPEAEVVALSPRTLMATNRFVCEVCKKGFQREQNLQLHRRGHNLPWKLQRQKSTTTSSTGGGEGELEGPAGEMIRKKKRVYVCPEPSCAHSHPSRALGDLTGIKKHYSRKHGEKVWRCERCSRRYAVASDWKAHVKACGSREYRCDCGTLFSRKDSFVTHRAFCDALAQETARVRLSAAAQNQAFPFQWGAGAPQKNPSPLVHHLRPDQGAALLFPAPTEPHLSATALLQEASGRLGLPQWRGRGSDHFMRGGGGCAGEGEQLLVPDFAPLPCGRGPTDSNATMSSANHDGGGGSDMVMEMMSSNSNRNSSDVGFPCPRQWGDC